MEPSREPDTGTACLCRLPSRKGSGRRRVGSPSRCGCTDLITWSPSTLAREAARAAGKRTASSWRPPSPWIPRPRRVVAFPFALEASLAARKRTSSRWKLLPLGIPGHRAVVGCPPDGGSLPRRREADGVTLDPPLAADTGTAPRRRLPLRRGKLPPARGAATRAAAGIERQDLAPHPSEDGSEDLQQRPRPEPLQNGEAGVAGVAPLGWGAPPPPALKGRQHKAWGVSPRNRPLTPEVEARSFWAHAVESEDAGPDEGEP
jgi:hypothetical protein